MKTFGLTGGIGMGKSAAAEILRSLSVPVVDTDELARVLVEPGQAALGEIRESFGLGMIDATGRLNRSKLAQMIFSDSIARKKLEDILHPKIRQLWKEEIQRWRSEGRPVGVVVIPLLFETGAQSELDATICVACSESSQNHRLALRNWNREEIKHRIDSQWPIDKKMLSADYVVWNESSLEVLGLQLDRIMKKGLGSRSQASGCVGLEK